MDGAKFSGDSDDKFCQYSGFERCSVAEENGRWLEGGDAVVGAR